MSEEATLLDSYNLVTSDSFMAWLDRFRHQNGTLVLECSKAIISFARRLKADPDILHDFCVELIVAGMPQTAARLPHYL